MAEELNHDLFKQGVYQELSRLYNMSYLGAASKDKAVYYFIEQVAGIIADYQDEVIRLRESLGRGRDVREILAALQGHLDNLEKARDDSINNIELAWEKAGIIPARKRGLSIDDAL